MDNVKFTRFEINGDKVDLYFKLAERLAYNVRQNTQYDEEELLQNLSKDDLFIYTINCSDDFADVVQPLIEDIERISNERDDEYLYNHVLTDNGYPRVPQEIHRLMYDEYGFVEVDDADENDEESRRAADLEWWTAHFFIRLRTVMFLPGHKRQAEDIAISRQDVAALLDAIKNLDIVVVDDARSIDPDEIKKHRD